MSDAVLEIKDLEVSYGPVRIIQGLNLTVGEGITTIVGRNGMGKTTLLKSIMSLATVTGGSIRFHGKEIAGLPPYRIAQAGVGYVPQGRMIFSKLTVDEQLRFVQRNPKNKENAWDAERVYDLFPRLKERRTSMGTSLSGGEQQMLAIGRTLTTNPDLLLMDEPSEGLAPVILDQLVAFIDKIIQSGVTVLLVEQNLPFAQQITDDVYVLVPGNFGYHGSLKELLANEELTQKFLVAGI